jgi:hypothetical protein
VVIMVWPSTVYAMDIIGYALRDGHGFFFLNGFVSI